MRFLVVAALVFAVAGYSFRSDAHLPRFDEACRALGGVARVSEDDRATNAECRDGLKISVYKAGGAL